LGGILVALLKDETHAQSRDLTEARGYLVVKSNDIIQKARFQLSLQEQKIILYLISRIKPSDEDFVHHDFSIVEFCKVCGIDHSSGGNYKAVKEAIKTLSDKSVWLLFETGVEVLVRWINKAWLSKKSGVIRLRLDDDMKPYLLQLRERFTQYELLYTLAMRSQYSIRLYELLKSYEYKGGWLFEIDELKQLLSAEKYTRFPDFKRYILDTALREINDLSDLIVSYEIIKVGRKYGKVEFEIKRKEDMEERLKTWARIDEAINPAQFSLFKKAYSELYGESSKEIHSLSSEEE